MMNGIGKVAAAWCCAAVWLVAGCSEEGATADGPGEPVAEEFRAVLPEAEESGEALVWEPGDTLGLWRDQYNVNLPFALTEDSIDDGGRRGLFYGTLYGAMSEGVSAWVYYPYDAGAAMTAQSVVTEFPGVQRCEPGRRPLVPLAGRYAGDPVWMEFAMRPLCAVVEAEVSLAAEMETPVRLQSIVFHGNNGERVSGAMTVSFADEVPSVSFASDLKAARQLTEMLIGLCLQQFIQMTECSDGRHQFHASVIAILIQLQYFFCSHGSLISPQFRHIAEQICMLNIELKLIHFIERKGIH